MAWELVDAVFDLDLPHVPKAVLSSLARHAQHHSKITWPSQATIAKESGLAPRSVRTGLTYLEKHQLVVPIGYPKGGRGHATIYELALTPSPEEEEETRQEVPGLNGHHAVKPAADATFETIKVAAPAMLQPLNVAKSAQNVAKNDVNVARIALNVAGDATESVKNLSLGICKESGEADARARAREDLSTDLRASLDPQKHQRRELWQRMIGVLNVRRADRQEWLDPCTLYEPTPHNFLLVAPTRAEQVYVDLHWGIAIWRELNLMHQTDDCTLALDYGAPLNAKQRSISA